MKFRLINLMIVLLLATVVTIVGLQISFLQQVKSSEEEAVKLQSKTMLSDVSSQLTYEINLRIDMQAEYLLSHSKSKKSKKATNPKQNATSQMQIEGNAQNNIYVNYNHLDLVDILPANADFLGAKELIIHSLDIYKLISIDEVANILFDHMNSRGIEALFEFGILKNNHTTLLVSEGFVRQNSICTSINELPVPDQYNICTTISKYSVEGNNIWVSLPILVLLLFVFILGIVFYFIRLATKQKRLSELKSSFINNMTHELKTPLITIRLACANMTNPKNIHQVEKINQYAGIINNENDRMKVQIDNILQLAKLEQNTLNIEQKATSVHDILEEVISHSKLRVEQSNGQIHKLFKAKRDIVTGDEVHLTNAFMNLVDNGIKYSPNLLVIGIETLEHNNQLEIRISDKGMGMTVAEQKQIFDKFYRVEKGNVHNVKGHGLGLAYTKIIIQDHHGEITVKSKKGEGSTFIIRLPLREENS